jgi:hypothetical protein
MVRAVIFCVCVFRVMYNNNSKNATRDNYTIYIISPFCNRILKNIYLLQNLLNPSEK